MSELSGSLRGYDDREREECLDRLELDGSVTIVDQDLTLTNGFAWSPDGIVLPSVDTTSGTVYARPYDPESGARR